MTLTLCDVVWAVFHPSKYMLKNKEAEHVAVPIVPAPLKSDQMRITRQLDG